MAYDAFASYVIQFIDQAAYDAAVAIHGNIYPHNPAQAATEFGITFPHLDLEDPFYLPGEPGAIYVNYPGQLNNIGHPSPSGVSLATNVDCVTVPGQPWGILTPGTGPDLHLCWYGVIVMSGGGSGVLPTPENLQPVKFVDGFEIAPAGEGAGNARIRVCRDASRTADGMGLAMRAATNVTIPHVINEFGGLQPSSGWERLYLRVRRVPGASNNFWRCQGSVSSAAGACLDILPSGAIAVYNVDLSSVRTLLGVTSALDLNVWYKLDVLVNWASSNGRIRLFLDRTAAGDFSVLTAAGLGQSGNLWAQSAVGECFSGVTENGLELDIDDWHHATIPTDFDGHDWLGGTHMQLIRPNGFHASHGTWVGDWRVLLQNFYGSESPIVVLTSSTSGAPISVTTDFDILRAQRGIQAMVVVGRSVKTGGAADGSLGYSIAGAAPVVTPIAGEPTTLNPSRVLYNTAVGPDPVAAAPLRLEYRKGADVNPTQVQSLMAVAMCVGAFGDEDSPDPDDVPAFIGSAGIHNSAYPTTPWAYQHPIPDGVVAVIGGTYNGNSLGQAIALAERSHLWWQRPLTLPDGGATWWSSMQGTHKGINERMFTELMLAAINPVDSNTSEFHVAGAHQQGNITGTTYQFIAICDPAMRFLVNGAFMHRSTLATAINTLAYPMGYAGFTPQALWFFRELMSGATTNGLYYKGPGHTGNFASPLNGAEVNSLIGAFAAGSITSLGAFHQDGQISYMACRMTDGTNPPAGEGVVFQILSYVGNGAGARTITLTPTSNRWPLFAMVVPHNAEAIFRDPSHTGSNSSPVRRPATVTTGITGGGIDQITVASGLNQNTIVYDVFVIPGSPNGWLNGTFYPLPPNVSPSTPYTPFPTPPVPPTPPSTGSACGAVFPIG